MISNDEVAEFIFTCVQNLVRFAGPEDDALTRFDGNRRFRATHAALTLKEDVHLPLGRVGMKREISRTGRLPKILHVKGMSVAPSSNILSPSESLRD
jgi:hypothetical protein